MIGGIIGFIFFIMVSIQRKNAAYDAFFNQHTPMLRNSDPKLRRKTVLSLIHSLEVRQTQRYRGEIVSLLLDTVKDDDWQIRCDVLRAFRKNFYKVIAQGKSSFDIINEDSKRRVVQTYINSFSDTNSSVRSLAINAFAELYRPGFWNRVTKGESYFSEEQFAQTLPELLNALSDEEAEVRAAAAAALKFGQNLELIPPLFKALQDEFVSVQTSANKALQELQKTVRMIVFAPQHWQRVLLNPDIPEQCVPFIELRDIEIHTDACDLALIERFCRYLQTAYEPKLLRKQISITIYGNPFVFSPETSAVWLRCRRVDVMLETVAFGDPECLPSPYPHSLTNPDFTPLTLPCNHLRRVLIDTEHADFHLLERFLTYLLAYLGQAYLDGVEVTLYGDPTRLHPNLYNNIRNMFRTIEVYEEVAKQKQ